MNKKLYEVANEKLETLNAVKDVLYSIECQYQFDYEYESDEEGNRTWNVKKDENGEPIKHLTECKYNSILDEVCQFLAKKYL